MLAYVEHAFRLDPLSTTDANAYRYGRSFDYSQSPLRPVPMVRYPVPLWEIR